MMRSGDVESAVKFLLINKQSSTPMAGRCEGNCDVPMMKCVPPVHFDNFLKSEISHSIGDTSGHESGLFACDFF